MTTKTPALCLIFLLMYSFLLLLQAPSLRVRIQRQTAVLPSSTQRHNPTHAILTKNQINSSLYAAQTHIDSMLSLRPFLNALPRNNHYASGTGPFFHNHPNTHHSTTTTPTIIPANFSIATLFPLCAIRPRRPALPFMDVDMEEKTSFFFSK